jgi:hypothetical protein
MQRLIHSLLLFIYSMSVHAQVPLGKLGERHKLDYKIQTTVLISSQVLKNLLNNNLLPIKTVEEQSIKSLSKQNAEDFSSYLIQNPGIIEQDTLKASTHAEIVFVQRTLLDSVIEHPNNFFTDFKLTSRKIARLHGITAVSVWFLSEFVQIISIPATAVLGVPEIGVMIVASPLNFINMGITIKAIDFSNQIKLQQAYGGFSKKKKAQRVQRKVYQAYKIKNENTLLHMLEPRNDTSYFISIDRNNIFTEIFSLLGLNPHKINYNNLKRFSRDKHNHDTLMSILKQNHISKEMRSLYACIYMSKRDPAMFEQFAQIHFKSISKQALNSQISRVRDDLKKWVFTLCELREIKDLEWVLRQVPSQVKVHEVMYLFDHIILKYWSENMNKQNYKAFRKMIKGFKKSSYQLLQQSDAYFNSDHIDLLLLNCDLFYTPKLTLNQ